MARKRLREDDGELPARLSADPSRVAPPMTITIQLNGSREHMLLAEDFFALFTGAKRPRLSVDSDRQMGASSPVVPDHAPPQAAGGIADGIHEDPARVGVFNAIDAAFDGAVQLDAPVAPKSERQLQYDDLLQHVEAHFKIAYAYRFCGVGMLPDGIVEAIVGSAYERFNVAAPGEEHPADVTGFYGVPRDELLFTTDEWAKYVDHGGISVA